MILHIKKATYIDSYRIELSFNNGRTGIADLAEVLWGNAFEALKEKSCFLSLKCGVI